jgi:MFS family permease
MGLLLGTVTARFGSRRVLLAVLWSLPVALVAYAVMPNLALAAIAIFFVGLIYLGALSSFMSIAQIRAPAAIRGRVVSLLAVVLGALYPLGSVVQGTVGHEVGLRETTAGAALLMLGALAFVRLRNPRFADALDEPPTPVTPSDPATARTDGCQDVDTDRLGLAPDEIPIPSADPS